MLEIAGIKVAIRCSSALFLDQIHARYKNFLCAGNPTPHLTLTLKLAPPESESAPKIIPLFEADGISFSETGYQGWIRPRERRASLFLASPTPLADLDYFLRVVYALLAFLQGALLFHAAGVLENGKVFLFFGPSGIGKTTIARLSAPRTILNDDLVLLSPRPEGWIAAGTPFWNPSQVAPENSQGPVHAMFRLIQDKKLGLQELPAGTGLAELMAGIPVLSTNPVFGPRLFDICLKLLQDIPVFKLSFAPSTAIWPLLGETLPVGISKP